MSSNREPAMLPVPYDRTAVGFILCRSQNARRNFSGVPE
jgi:hypothetical protein